MKEKISVTLDPDLAHRLKELFGESREVSDFINYTLRNKLLPKQKKVSIVDKMISQGEDDMFRSMDQHLGEHVNKKQRELDKEKKSREI